MLLEKGVVAELSILYLAYDSRSVDEGCLDTNSLTLFDPKNEIV